MYCRTIKLLPGGSLKRHVFRSLMTAPPAGVKTRDFQLNNFTPKISKSFSAISALFAVFLRLKLLSGP